LGLVARAVGAGVRAGDTEHWGGLKRSDNGGGVCGE
jgi:hypothetical protein